MAHARASKQDIGYKNNYANLPQEVHHESYPKRSYPLGQNGYPDDINLMDKSSKKDSGKIARSRSHY